MTGSITGSSQPDPNSANDTVSATITPDRTADLNVFFVDRPVGNLSPGTNVGLFIEVNNHGPASTSGVTARFLIPPGYRNVGGGPQVGSYDLTTGVWTIGAMPAFSLARLILSAKVNETGFTGLTTNVTSDQPDPNLADNSVTFPPINRPPVMNAGPDQTAITNTLVNLDGTQSGDPETDPVQYTWTFIMRPANSTATLSGSQTTTPSFVPDQPGRYIAQLSGTDSHAVAGTPDTVTIFVSLGDRAPAIISTPPTSATAGQLFRYDIDAFEPDAGDVLTFSLDTLPPGMTIDPTTGLIAWTPSEGQAGPQQVVARVRDAGGLFATQPFTIQVSSPSNHAPKAVDDAYEVRSNESLSVNASGVLANDADADGAPLTAKLLTSPANGTLNFSQDGSFTYTPHVMRESDLVQIDNVNLATRVPGVVIEGSDSGFGGFRTFAADDTIGTSWRANLSPFARLDVVFPIPVTVTEMQIVGTRELFLIANQMRPRAGFVQLFDANGAELFTSGVIDLPAPSGDVTIKVPNVSGVRRAAVTITENEAGRPFTEASLAEFKVIGSALIRRPQVVEPNVGLLLPTTVSASSVFAPNTPESAIDETGSNWYAASGSPGEFLEFTYPVDVTVDRLQLLNPNGRPDGFGTSLGISCSGHTELFDAAGTVLFNTGVINSPSGPVGDSIQVTLPVPSVPKVRRVRWTSDGCGASFPPGFAEFRVFGSAAVNVPPISIARKFQALTGREIHSTPMVANFTDDNHDGRIDLNDIPDIAVPAESTTSQLKGETQGHQRRRRPGVVHGRRPGHGVAVVRDRRRFAGRRLHS